MKVLSLLMAVFLIVSCTHEKAKNVKLYEEYINTSWYLQSSKSVTQTGADLSVKQVALNDWYKIEIPATIIAGLRQNGLFEDIYFSNNIENVSTKDFENSWWYVKDFKIDNYSDNEYYSLNFEGINYRANVWLNGKLIASANTIEGPFRMFNFDITNLAEADNRVAVEIFPPDPTSLTIGFVDWNPTPPDKNTGIWRGVKLNRSGKVSINNVAIKTKLDLDNYSEANISLQAEITNHSNEKASGKFKTVIDEGIVFEVPYELLPNETKQLLIDSNTNPELKLKNPRVWWPVNMGNPELYTATFSVFTNGKVSHEKNERFGIREISDYTFDIDGVVHRGYKINGKKILLKGGGWVDDIFLSDSDEKVRAQVEYVKHLNLNTIRLEGFWGNSKALYDACEENGILLMIGLSCQWEWTSYCNRPESDFMCVESDYDMQMVAQSFQDQVKWGLNNPSIFVWVYGSDKLPLPAFEVKLDSAIRAYDTERKTLVSCQNVLSKVSGPSGAKMFGPYEYVAPIYWYQDTKHGGAYGFNTETGPGSQIPPIESIRKMLKAEDVPLVNQEGWQYHSGRNEFQNLNVFLNIYEKRYWKDSDIDDFAFNVQMSNYESVRSMFEAFVINRTTKSTGVVQWMLNSAWPEMYWQLYDWYLNPNGAFYGTKNASRPLNIIYNYGDKQIYLSNDLPIDSLLKAEIQLFDINSNLITKKEIDLNAKKESVEKIFTFENFSAPSDVYFLSLKLLNEQSKEVANNFYWLSKKEDILDYKNSEWFYTPPLQNASFVQLKEYEPVQINSDWAVSTKDNETEATVTLTNPTDKIAFFIEMRLTDKKTGETILPVFWSDNYVSLLPNETKVYDARINIGGMKMADLDLKIKSFNN